MGRKPTVTQAQRDSILLLHREGRLGRNAIAREVGVSPGTVTTICRELGLAFDRAATAEAVAARQLDLKDLRTQLERDLLEDAARLRAQLWRPATYVQYGGKEFTRRTDNLDEPLPADKLKLVQATTLAAAQSLKLTEANRETGTDEAKSMLGQLKAQLLETFTAAQEEEAAGDG